MLMVKIKTVHGTTDFFETDKYSISKTDIHPDILEYTVFSSLGKKLAHWKRPRPKFYMKYEYKPIPREQQ